MNPVHLLSPLCLAAALTTSLVAQTPGNFDDHVVWDYSLRYTQEFTYVDDDGDGLRALWAAAPGSATLYRLDENGSRLDIRGATGTRFGHRFVVGPILPGGRHAAAVASNTSGTHYLSFFDNSGGSAGPLTPMPGSIGFLIDLVLGNFDADSEQEVGVVGTTGWGFWDGGTTSFVPVQENLSPGAFSANVGIRGDNIGNGPDRLIVPSSRIPIEIREFDVLGNSMLLDTLPASEARVDSITRVLDRIALSTSSGSFTQPSGKIWMNDPVTDRFSPIVTGQPADSFPRISAGGPIVTERQWFFVRKRFAVRETLEEMTGTSGSPQVSVQGPSGIGLDIAEGGAQDMFPGNTRHLIVRQAATHRFSAYQIEGPVDLRMSNRGATTGNSLQADVFLGAAGAGATVYPLMSLSGSATLRIPGLGRISLMPDAFTSPSVAYLGGPQTADPSGQGSFQMPVPGVPIGRYRAEVSLGFVALKTSGQVLMNQTGGFGYVDVQ